MPQQIIVEVFQVLTWKALIENISPETFSSLTVGSDLQDFHTYCWRLVHWDIQSSAVDDASN